MASTTLPGAGLDPVIVHQAAAATIRSFLGRLAGAITDPAAARSGTPAAPPSGQARWLLPRPDHGSWETLITG
jgi:hypothetical protein